MPPRRFTAGNALVQAKLTVGPAGDASEREADAVASRVMRSLRSDHPGEFGAGLPERPRRQVRLSTSNATRVGTGGGVVDDETHGKIRRATGRGRPLDAELRGSMERGFGVDFSAVRIHDDPASHQLSAQLSAKAFTTGNDVFFGAGNFQPSSSAGQQLVAHELTHVVQQAPAIRRELADGAALGPQAQKEAMAARVEARTPSKPRPPSTPRPGTARAKSAAQHEQEIQALIAAARVLRVEASTTAAALEGAHRLDDVEQLIRIGVGLGLVKIGTGIAGIAAEAEGLGVAFKTASKLAGKAQKKHHTALMARLAPDTDTSTATSAAKSAAKGAKKANSAREWFDDGGEAAEATGEVGLEEALEFVIPVLGGIKTVVSGVKDTYEMYKEQRQALGTSAVKNVQGSVESLTQLYADVSTASSKFVGPQYAQVRGALNRLAARLDGLIPELVALAAKFQAMREATQTAEQEIDWDNIETRPRSEKNGAAKIADAARARKRSPIKETQGTAIVSRPGNMSAMAARGAGR